jgi:hypothetical protein
MLEALHAQPASDIARRERRKRRFVVRSQSYLASSEGLANASAWVIISRKASTSNRCEQGILTVIVAWLVVPG